MANVEIVKVDQGGANARILAREAKVDFRRVEAASLKIATRFSSAEGKRMFVRMFNTLQLNMHFISVIARTRLDHEDIGRIETALRGRIDAATASLNEAIDGAEALFKAHGITSLASYDTVPLDVDVRVLSSISRRFLEVLVKLDQLMPLLQTLEIHEVVSAQAVDTQRAGLKRQVRDIANGARSFATGLRRRMNALDARATSPDDAEGPDVAHGAAIGEAVDSTTRAPDGPADPHRQRAETWSRCLRQRQSLRWRSRRWNCRPSDVSPKRRHPPTLARAIGAGVLPVSGADATVCPGHGLPAEASRRHRSADHPFNGRIAPGLHPHRVASQSIPASSNVGTLPPACRPVPADPPRPARRPNAPGAGLGPPRHRTRGPAPLGGRHAPPRGWRSNHTEEGPRQGPSSEGIFIHRANGTPAVVQESSVPGRLARFLTERRRRRAGHDLCRLHADERPIMPRVSVPAALSADSPAAAPSAALPDTGFLRQPQVLSFVPISKSTLWRRVHARTFPEPVKLSERVTVWRAEDIRRWIEQQGVAS